MERIEKTKGKGIKPKRFTRSELLGWRSVQEENDGKVKPDFLEGQGTASEGYREAWKTRNDRSQFLEPWDAGDSASKGKYLAPEMAAKCVKYYDELKAFASNKVNEPRIKDILGVSSADFQFTLEEWKKMTDNYSSIARSAYRILPGQSFTSEQREQAFHLLAMMLDRLQYMQWRIKNADKGILNEATLNKACEILARSREESSEYYRAFFTIWDAIQSSHHGISDHSSREQQPSDAIKKDEIFEPNVTAPPSDNLVIFRQKLAELKEKGTIIKHLLDLEEIKKKSKRIPEINYCEKEEIFKEIQAFEKKYCLNCNGKNRQISLLDRKIEKIIEKME